MPVNSTKGKERSVGCDIKVTKSKSSWQAQLLGRKRSSFAAGLKRKQLEKGKVVKASRGSNIKSHSKLLKRS